MQITDGTGSPATVVKDVTAAAVAVAPPPSTTAFAADRRRHRRSPRVRRRRSFNRRTPSRRRCRLSPLGPMPAMVKSAAGPAAGAADADGRRSNADGPAAAWTRRRRRPVWRRCDPRLKPPLAR